MELFCAKNEGFGAFSERRFAVTHRATMVDIGKKRNDMVVLIVMIVFEVFGSALA